MVVHGQTMGIGWLLAHHAPLFTSIACANQAGQLVLAKFHEDGRYYSVTRAGEGMAASQLELSVTMWWFLKP